MMYLSQITLSRKNCYELRVTDDYSIHRVVYDLFPLENRGFLYADKGARGGFYTILVLSDQKPQPQTDISVITKPVSESFLKHERYRFEILLNPVRRNHQTRKLEPVLGQLPLLQWFVQKGRDNGFTVEETRLEVRVLPTQQFTSKERDIVQHKVLFSGELTVADRTLFEQAFTHGIGRSKGFGFGLLQLTPMN